MGRENDVSALQPQIISVITGGGSATLIGATAGQVGGILKWMSGGSLEIFYAPVGVSSGSQPAGGAAGSSGYLVGTAELVSVTGPARFYLVATGSNAVCHYLRAMGPGF